MGIKRNKKTIFMKLFIFYQKLKDERQSKKLIKRLYSIPKDEWIGIAHTFNSWDFPMKFYDLIPKWWLKNKDASRAMRIISPLMGIIKKEFGEKEQLRYHNVYLGKMTNDEFEYWYSLEPFGEQSSKYYDKKFKVEQIKWWEEDVFNKISKLNLW